MIWLLGALLLVVPWLELWLMLALQFSITLAVLLGLGTAGVGWWFSRGETLDLWSELDADIQNGRVPTEEGIDAMLMVLGGWALIIPGLLTDLLGAAMLIGWLRGLVVPPIRQYIRSRLL